MVSAKELLDEARAAYHDLQIGKAVASARDSNGEEVRYTQADRTELSAYITSLQNQISPGEAGAIGPMRFRF